METSPHPSDGNPQEAQPKRSGHGKLPPGPGGGFGLNRLIHRLRNHADFFEQLFAQYGDIAYFSMAGQKFCIVFGPEVIDQVLVSERRAFEKGPLYHNNRILKNPTTMTTVGKEHRRLRRLVQPSFRTKAMQGYSEIMIDEAIKLRDGWVEGSVVNVDQPMHQLALDIVGRAFFGPDSRVESSLLKGVLNALTWDAILNVVPLGWWIAGLPLPRNRRSRRAIESMDEVVYEVVGKARADDQMQRTDLVSYLVHAVDDEEGEPALSNEEVRDESYVMFIAGHETSANTLVWCMYHLSANPETRVRVEAEVDEVLEGRRPTFDDFSRLTYTGAVFDEVLRLTPPAMVIGRRAVRDCEVGGYHIPKGTVVQAFVRAPHRNEKYWPNATEFRPQRWLEERERQPKQSYLPFGAGESKCLGAMFAKMEVVFTLAAITQRWRLDAVSKEFPVVDSLAGFYRCKHGMPCRVESRT